MQASRCSKREAPSANRGSSMRSSRSMWRHTSAQKRSACSMFSSSQRPSLVWYGFTNGLNMDLRVKDGMPDPLPAPSMSLLDTMSGPSTHMAVPSREMSTTGPSPVRSFWRSPAAMPPAMVMAPMESPKAAFCMTGDSAWGGVMAWPMPPRDQKEAAS